MRRADAANLEAAPGLESGPAHLRPPTANLAADLRDAGDLACRCGGDSADFAERRLGAMGRPGDCAGGNCRRWCDRVGRAHHRCRRTAARGDGVWRCHADVDDRCVSGLASLPDGVLRRAVLRPGVRAGWLDFAPASGDPLWAVPLPGCTNRRAVVASHVGTVPLACSNCGGSCRRSWRAVSWCWPSCSGWSIPSRTCCLLASKSRRPVRFDLAVRARLECFPNLGFAGIARQSCCSPARFPIPSARDVRRCAELATASSKRVPDGCGPSTCGRGRKSYRCSTPTGSDAGFTSRRAGDRCLLFYNQPLRHPKYLALVLVVSHRECSLATFRRTLTVLDEVARVKRSDAILCDAWNERISDRLLARWGWESHKPQRWHRNYIKRFYGTYPPAAVDDTTAVLACQH